MLARWKCTRIDAQLWAYTAGQLTPEDAARVQQHLQSCAACRKRLEQTQQTASLVAAYRDQVVPASETNWQDLRLRLQAQSVQAANSAIIRRGQAISWGVAAAAVLAVVFVMARYKPVTGPSNNVAINNLKQGPPKPYFSDFPEKPAPKSPQKSPKPYKQDVNSPQLVQVQYPPFSPIRHRHHHWRRHSHHLRASEPALEQPLNDEESTAPGWLAKVEQLAKPAPMLTEVAFSVDGDRPTLRRQRCDFVMPGVGSPDRSATAPVYVIGSVASFSGSAQASASTAADKELNIW